MKPDLSNDEFQKLEKTCLLLDILIDCEEYDEFDNIVFEQIFQKFKKYSIFIQQIDNPTKEEVAKGIEAIVTRPFHSKYYEYFSIIITSKYIRRLLAENKKGIKTEKTEKLFEELTETLIKIIRKRSDDANTNILRLIFLNEISASSAGNLAKGYADIVLDELRGLNQKWHLKKGNEKSIKHPYELYALYNIGLAFLHDRTMEGTSEMAIETFRQILKPFNNENSENTLRTNFSNEYKSYKNLFDIFFWLIYIPTQNLTVEAFSDQNSSRNREETIEEALGKIKDTPVTLKNGDELDLRIKNYHKSQLTIQLSLAKIDSGYFTADLMYGAGEYEWLNAFKVHSEDSIEPLEKLSEFIPPLDKHPNIKNKLDTAKAIFWLENAMASQEIHNRQESCIKSFDLCIDHLKNQQSSDWSDFAIILLDNVLFLLEKQNSEFSEQIIYKDKTRSKPKNRPKEFQKYYKKILDDLVRRGWIQRKKELTEKFLKCQDKLLGHYEKKPQMAKYLGYQIKLVKSIKGDIDNKNFQKKWSEQGKIKLIKQLRYYVDLCNKNDLKKKFEKEIKETRENIFPEEDKLDDLRDFIKRRLNCDFYHKKLRFNTEAFNDHLIYKSCRPSLQNCYGLTVLRRWQSFTPALSSGSEVGEKGGGYFVYKTNDKGEIEEGIVVDPGFNFLENFFDEGFSIRDINAILLTHSHRDHSSDLMSIITLVHEMNKRGKRVFKKQWKNTKLVLFMTEGCYYKYEKQIGHESIKSFRDIIKVKCGKEYGEKDFLEEFRLKVVKALHDDLTDHDSVGYIIKNKKFKPLIGFTGDTQWYPNIEEEYKIDNRGCPVLCMNIGGVVDIFKEGGIMLSDLATCNSKNDHRNFMEKILITENHLYLPGLYWLAKDIVMQSKRENKLFIVSELCEEMKGGLRIDLAEKLEETLREDLAKKLTEESNEPDLPENKKAEDYVSVLPEDIGLTVILDNDKEDEAPIKVVCKVCNSGWEPKDIKAVETDKDSAIVYLCKEHYNQLKVESILPKINELELDINELRKPLIK